MATFDFSRYSVYRWRYQLGYTLLGLLLAGVLVFAGFFVPGGLSEAEKASVVTSQGLTFTDLSSFAVTDLPYHFFQDAILTIFGITTFTIKLPSLVLALLSALGMIFLLRRWFKPNIAILASLIAISTGQFLFIAQLGTPEILYVFWPVALLFLGTQVTRQKKYRLLWKILFGLVVAFSLYTPYSVYIILATGLTIALHPHLRNVIRKLSNKKMLLTGGLALLASVPLIAILIIDPSLWGALFGIPTSWPDFGANVQTVTQQYLMFWDPAAAVYMTPVFGLGSFLLIILGLYRLVRTLDTTRSYLVSIWLLFLLPIILIDPAPATLVFLPTVLLLAAGLTSLISYWYRLFPRNPYARVAGLIPIIILIVVLIGSGLMRYIHGYHYGPEAARAFSQDLNLLPRKTTDQLIVANDEHDFYYAAYRYDGTIGLTNKPTADRVALTRKANDTTDMSGYKIVDIITSARSTDADRFYVYERVE